MMVHEDGLIPAATSVRKSMGKVILALLPINAENGWYDAVTKDRAHISETPT
jgi:hypothetical protein